MRAGRVINKRKMAKHFTLTVPDGAFGYQRNEQQIKHQALLVGIYMLRTDQPAAARFCPA